MDSNINILLIDDDQDEYILLKAMFSELPGQEENEQYVLYWARGYEDAIRKSDRRHYDLFLVDYYLGQYTGLQVMQALRARGCDAPFILLTGQGSYELDLSAMQQGVADYLLKDQLNAYVLERSIRYTLERQSIQDNLERLVLERTAELRYSEARFRSLAETTSAAIFIVQNQFILYANPAAWFLTGYAPDELENMELWQLAHPAYQDAMRLEEAPGWAEGVPLRYEVKILHRSGEERWVDITAAKVVMDGSPALLLTAFDITERDRAERELRRMKDNLEHLVAMRTEEARVSEAEAHQRAEELDGLQRATSALLSTLELEEMFAQILSAARSAIPAADKGMLCLVSVDCQLAPPSAVLGYPDHELQLSEDEPAWRCMAQAIREHNPVLIKVEGDEKGRRGSWIASPLIIEEQVLGALALGSNDPLALKSINLRLLASFAAAATTALQNAILHGEMKYLAESDSLTGKYNRRAFFELGEKALWRARRNGQQVSAIMIDLDNFKPVNDILGHTAGDQVLREVANRCRSRIRDTDIFGRYGGDEFVILLPGASLEIASAIAERILESILDISLEFPDHSLHVVSSSLGVASDRPGLSGLSELINEADRAMYAAKLEGKCKVNLFQGH